MYPSVSRVQPHEDFTLSIVFDNGDEGVLDMKPFLDFGVFQELKDFERFKTVRIVFDSLDWDGGIDLDPEFIYEKCRITILV